MKNKDKLDFINQIVKEQDCISTADLSTRCHNSGIYNDIKDIAKTDYGKDIDNDSQFWYDLEEYIINKIKHY